MIIPELMYLYVNPSGECNLSCRHCWIAPAISRTPFEPRMRDEVEFSLNQFHRLLNDAFELGLKYLKFTGGEPLLRSDFPDLYAIAAGKNLLIDIETNGTLQPDGLWEAFDSYPPRSVAVSLDSTVEDEHDDFRNTGGAWARTVDFLGELRSREINTQVIMSSPKYEVQPVLRMARFCQENQISSLKINPVQPIGRGVGFIGKDYDISSLLEFAVDIHGICGKSVNVDIPPAFLPLGRIKDSGWCPIHNLLGILPDGGISFCGIGFSCSELVMGNFITDRIEDIWKGAALLKRLRTQVPVEQIGICSNCIHSARCLGKCVMQNYYSNSDFISPFWICQMAEDVGIFPETRKISPDA